MYIAFNISQQNKKKSHDCLPKKNHKMDSPSNE